MSISSEQARTARVTLAAGEGFPNSTGAIAAWGDRNQWTYAYLANRTPHLSMRPKQGLCHLPAPLHQCASPLALPAGGYAAHPKPDALRSARN
jgi:hypothetical protein